MDTLSRILPTTQDFDDLLDAFDRMSVDHVTGESTRERRLDISTLRRHLMYVKLMKDPRNVDELVAMTEEHYTCIRNAAEESSDERREHRLTAADYGLSHRVA